MRFSSLFLLSTFLATSWTSTTSRRISSATLEEDEVVQILRTVDRIVTSRIGVAQFYDPDISIRKSQKRLPPLIADRLAALKLVNYRQSRKGGDASRLPVEEATPDTPELQGHHFEGDIVLRREQAETLLDRVLHSDDRRHKRKFVRDNLVKWDASRPIEYSFDGSHTPKEQEYISLALEHWQNVTCLTFRRVDTEPSGNRIVFTDSDGCASRVGRSRFNEPQLVSIAQECMRLGIIAHEVAHALGFWHEQSRPDRDEHVTIMWGNIEYGSAGQFTKELSRDAMNNGIEYDYGSIMHYSSKAHTREGELFTIRTNVGDYQRTIGQRDQLSFNDIKLMNKMYCQHSCPVKLDCKRGGYTDPRNCDRCKCPDGFTGRICDSVTPGYGSDCGGIMTVGSKPVDIQSPGYPKKFKKGQECSWLLRAPAGQHVKLDFKGDFDLHCNSEHSLCKDYVEVRNTTNFANTGMRYCCYSPPSQSTYSATNEMLVLLRSFYSTGHGFRATARAVRATGTYGPWGAWSECSASCGGCGTRIRHRHCNSGFCTGPSSQVESCNSHVCDVCDQVHPEVVPCGLFSLFRCRKVIMTNMPCRDRCCPGYEPRNGHCISSLKR